MSQIDLDWMEVVIASKVLNDEVYLLSVIDHLKPHFFTDSGIRLIVTIIRAFYDKRKALPTVTEIKALLLTQEQKDQFKAALKRILSIDTQINKDELYENTERFIKEKGIYDSMKEVIEDISKGNIDTGKILNSFEKSCNVSLVHDIGLDMLNEYHLVKEDLTRLSPVISTGYKWLDEKLDGGFLRDGRAMYVFAGETNIGKSIILGNLAINIAQQGKTVLLVTLEMSEYVYARRLSATISGIRSSQLGPDIDIVEDQINIFREKSGGRIIVKEFPPSIMTPRDIQGYIKKLEKKGIKVDAIVLDYINLLTSKRGKDSYERIKYVSEETRGLTYEFKCPLITATQLNRQGYAVHEPGLTSLGESYALGATADFVCSAWRSDEDKLLNLIRLTLLKNRFGLNTGTQEFKVDYPTLKISNVITSTSGVEYNPTTQISTSLDHLRVA